MIARLVEACVSHGEDSWWSEAASPTSLWQHQSWKGGTWYKYNNQDLVVVLVLLLRRLLGHRTGFGGMSRQVLRHCREFQMKICASAAYLTPTSVTRLAENIGKFHWLVISFVIFWISNLSQRINRWGCSCWCAISAMWCICIHQQAQR